MVMNSGKHFNWSQFVWQLQCKCKQILGTLSNWLNSCVLLNVFSKKADTNLSHNYNWSKYNPLLGIQSWLIQETIAVCVNACVHSKFNPRKFFKSTWSVRTLKVSSNESGTNTGNNFNGSEFMRPFEIQSELILSPSKIFRIGLASE